MLTKESVYIKNDKAQYLCKAGNKNLWYDKLQLATEFPTAEAANEEITKLELTGLSTVNALEERKAYREAGFIKPSDQFNVPPTI